MFALRVQNLRALRNFDWSPDGPSILVGANGAGKTTVLLLLKMLRAAYDRGLPAAVSTTLGGSYNLRNYRAAQDEPTEVGLKLGDLSWTVSLIPRGPSVDYLADETLMWGDEVVLRKDSLGKLRVLDQVLSGDERLGIRAAVDAQIEHPALERLSAFLQGITVFHDPDLVGLRQAGSRATEDRHLHSRGRNAFTMLRKWNETKEGREQVQFVLKGLRAAFPAVVEDFDFETSGQTVNMRIYEPGAEVATPIGHMANGVLAMLLLLTQVADGVAGGVVAIDEPEHALHPWAIREFYRQVSSWTRRRGSDLILATHSPVLLDQVDPEPERIAVLTSGDERTPVRLNEIRDPEWLASFKAGDLYVENEFASNIG